MSVEMDLGSISFAVFLVFLILKLCGVITWPWAVVCIPLYVLALIFVVFVLLVIIGIRAGKGNK